MGHTQKTFIKRSIKSNPIAAMCVVKKSLSIIGQGSHRVSEY